MGEKGTYLGILVKFLVAFVIYKINGLAQYTFILATVWVYSEYQWRVHSMNYVHRYPEENPYINLTFPVDLLRY